MPSCQRYHSAPISPDMNPGWILRKASTVPWRTPSMLAIGDSGPTHISGVSFLNVSAPRSP